LLDTPVLAADGVACGAEAVERAVERRRCEGVGEYGTNSRLVSALSRAFIFADRNESILPVS
jgi:hypothetical protein